MFKNILVCNYYMWVKTKNQFYYLVWYLGIISACINLYLNKRITVFNDEIISLKINQQQNLKIRAICFSQSFLSEN